MYQEDLDDVTKFAQDLPRLRQQVSDTGLLDQCQNFLNMLLQQMMDSDIKLGNRPEEMTSPPQ